MIRQAYRKNENVIQINKHKMIQEISQYIISELGILQGCW